ncbi:Na+/H+ antiporter NhaA [Thioalbus denitrificans]|uniref:Na(+)/H(+) antiporter NhaA n=1 Tax=Thioalbus denitrificans TaxID=547122 RepID=A0A369CF77_9GAMM|nr:Na+/H+ antiporter NhaA [Thioalbus denitrificans]RCX31898.1 sodium/proton antiporter (NhaA family) [Thioalbus denitrificans]
MSRPEGTLPLLREFYKLESAGGILLIFAAALALVLANSPLDRLYAGFLDIPVEIRIGGLHLAKPLLLWINDGLMAVFFFLVGLEIKREMLAGQLSDPRQVILPAIAAVGGMAVPALIYTAFNLGDPVALEGWAIPTATDIAFALGVLALLGDRVPLSLKVFLTALAILDDMGAILIIAAFYTSNLSPTMLLLALVGTGTLVILNRARVSSTAPYILVGIFLWVCVLKSGVHATLAGVALGLAIPLRDPRDPERSPLRELEHRLHPWVAYGILPLFAFANAGVSFTGLTPASLLEPIPLGIALGLLLGKTVGVFSFSAVPILLGWSRLPEQSTWAGLLGVAILCGIGFTMSLFIGSLAFEQDGLDYAVAVRLGVLGGSLVAAVAGYLLLRRVLPRPASR